VSVRITTEVLDAMNTGLPHDLALVTKARRILEAAGCEVEIHDAEKAEIHRLRMMAQRLHAEADEMATRLDSA
jgi:hypothetical protein